MALVETQLVAEDLKASIMSFAHNFSTETTPARAKKIASFRDHLQPNTSVYITFLPGSDFADTIETAKRLSREGFNPVPHIAARSIPSVRSFDDRLARLKGEAGVTEALVIAGGIPRPIGPFSDSMKLLETGLLDKHGITRIGVAGHPEGSPDIREDDLAAALSWKNRFSQRTAAKLHIVTQMCFEAGVITRWGRMIQLAGNRLPVRVGIPGIANIKTLLNYARLCGIGPSVQLLTRQGRSLAKLLTLSVPDGLVRQLASYKSANLDCDMIGCHLYPLGGFERTARWASAVAAGRFTIQSHAEGFLVEDLR
jgi:methylenetetrahydrofolate reductase (NADPH)